MSDNNQEKQNQQGADQFNNPAPGGDGEQEFSFAEEKKPINRNLVLLLLITIVGASLVYLMYVRTQFNADSETPTLIAANQEIGTLMKDTPQSIREMEEQIKKTQKTVQSFQQKNSSGQVSAEELKTNPFAIEEPAKPVIETKRVIAPTPEPIDTLSEVQQAADKAKVQMILLSQTGNSAQINDWIYKEGELLNIGNISFKIKKITRDQVILTNPAGEFTLQFN